MTDVPGPGTDRPDTLRDPVTGEPVSRPPEPPATPVGPPLAAETPPWPPTTPPETTSTWTPPPAPVAPARRGPLGLGWPWWIGGGCALLLLCCLCSLLLALALATLGAGPRTPTPPTRPAAPTVRPPASQSEEAAPAETIPQQQPDSRFGVNPTGQVAQDFALRTLDGQTLKLSDLRGRPVVVNFWASWCGPCKAEMPLLSKAHDELKDTGLVILAVDVQEMPSVVQRYVEQNKLPFTVVLDQTGSVSEQYRVRALPTTFFIDANGVVQSWQVGTLSQTTLQRHLDRIR